MEDFLNQAATDLQVIRLIDWPEPTRRERLIVIILENLIAALAAHVEERKKENGN